MSSKLPLIYHDRYNIRLWGLQRLHPFDTEKYAKIHAHLLKYVNLRKDQFWEPEAVTDTQLGMVHSNQYLQSLQQAETIAQVAEMGLLSSLPVGMLQRHLLAPMRYACQGTILGVELALEEGWAVNLSGGYHHAKPENGEGFCFFADIPIAIYQLWEKRPDLKVLVVDLDAHQGNGIEAAMQGAPNCFIMDVYNADIYPRDHAVKQYIDFDFPLASYTDDEGYLAVVRTGLDEAIAVSKPDLIIYNAGTDIYEQDPLGALRVSETGILLRDAYVWEAASRNAIPLLMVPSGGYFAQSGPMIGRSLERILAHKW